ncbi:hypothetical protein L6164_002163 [Bauhinia variegata]|uniref:Uncharacterized protein n=1 Tax=Bauhinia variegata TaxID=167791 RepID=A0ACB9PX68_BAUVA|nr:hypothetical protein L6164_002163 [Bauhinia variegata]
MHYDNARVLDWRGYPSSSLPSEFHPRKLAILNLHNSFLTWYKAFKLKEINFWGCKFVKQVSDLSEARNLTELHIDFCKNLIIIHDSIGFLHKLKVISAESCVNLRIFSRFIMLKSLKMLNLKYCSSLHYFPEILEDMENLSYIYLRKTAIEELPCSIHNATGLSCLELSFCEGLKKVPTCILKLPKLERLHVVLSSVQFNKERGEQDQVRSTQERIDLQCCNFLDGFLPTFLGCLSNVAHLILGDSSLTLLPESIQECKFLSHLNLDNCKQLREIRGIPPNIKVLSAINCTSLVTLLPESIQECEFLTDLNLDNCKQPREIRGIPPNIKVLSAINCTSLTPSALSLLVDQVYITLPGTRIPKFFDHYGKRESLSFWFRNKFPDIALFVVVGPNKMFSSITFECNVSVNGNLLDHWFQSYPISEVENTFQYNLRRRLNLDEQGMVYPEDEWNHAEISYIFKTYKVGRRKKPLVQQTGIYIFDRARNQRDILFTNPNPK